MLAELISDAAVHPIDVVKVFQQASSTTSISFVGAAAVLLARGGPSSLLAGIWPFCLFNMAGGALKFQSYETVRAAAAHR